MTEEHQTYEQAKQELLAKIRENANYREDLRVGIWGGATLSMTLIYGTHLVNKYFFHNEIDDSSFMQYFIPQLTFTVGLMWNILLDRKVRSRKYARQLSELEEKFGVGQGERK